MAVQKEITLYRIRWFNNRLNAHQEKWFVKEKKYLKKMGYLNSMAIVFRVICHGPIQLTYLEPSDEDDANLPTLSSMRGLLKDNP